jgi:hypothetical protein
VRKILISALCLLVSFLVIGCGGGGGTAAPPTTPPTTPAAAPTLSLTPQGVKIFRFTWADVSGETEYRLLENPDSASGYTQVATIAANATSHDYAAFLPRRINASYILQACNGTGCTDSEPVNVTGSLAAAVGYVKASNTETHDIFGASVALAADGNTLAIGAQQEGSSATGINGNQTDNSAAESGAVYVFTRSAGVWSQQAYVKASNSNPGDGFGVSLALAADGNTLAVGAPAEDSNATGINGNQADNSILNTGAVYVFTRSGNTWSQQAYVKASDPGADDRFGMRFALAADGATLAIGAYGEDSSANGINGNQADNSASNSGAVYVFTRSAGVWSQQAYVKASNAGADDWFGWSVALAADGNTLAVGAPAEDSSATGINGNQADNSASNSGAVYVFTRSASVWSQQAYVKASNAGADDWFGSSVALADDGDTLAVGAQSEDSSATGIGGNQADNSALNSGAAYVFIRSGSIWSQQAYVKASNTEAGDSFSFSIALTADGNTLAVGAIGEGSNAIGIGGDQADNSAGYLPGAAYVFFRSGNTWSQQAYVKASNTGFGDLFGYSIALAADGNTLAVGAIGEGSSTIGIGGNQADNSAGDSGAVYLY